MNPSPHPPRGFGCLAVFSVLCLSLFTAGEVALLWRLNPDWFDRRAYWRGPILEPDLIVRQDPASRDARKREFEARHTPAPAPTPRKVRLFEPAAVSGDYDPAQGLTLTNPAAAELKLSPGAVAEHARVSLTPLLNMSEAMRVPVAGPLYDVRIGSHEHYEFRGNVTITLPFRPELREVQPVVAVWEGNAWKELPTTINADKNTVTATVPHVSVLGVLGKAWGILKTPIPLGASLTGIGTLGTLAVFVATDPTSRANVRAGWWWAKGGRIKETNSFVIHYMTEGDHAVVLDRPYVLRGSRSAADHPLFVEDIAKFLEDASVRLDLQGIKIPLPRVIRHDVFLLSIDDMGDELGNSDLGGPVILSTKLPRVAFENKDTVDPEGLIRSVVAHELTHLAQGAHFSVVGGYQHRWFIEASAEFLGDRTWKPQKNYDTLRKFTLAFVGDHSEPIRADRLPAFPFDSTDDTKYYSHALFFDWLDGRHGGDGGLRVIRDMYDRSEGSLESLDQSTRRLVQIPLADLFVEYASDFYYRDQWRGTLTPRPHKGLTPREQMLAQVARSGGPASNLAFAERTFVALTGPGERNEYASTAVPTLRHLSAVPLYVHAGVMLPEARKGRLVVKIEPRGGGLSPHLRILQAADKVGVAPLPLTGSPGALSEARLENNSLLIDNFATVGGDDRMTLLFVNKSLTEPAREFEVSRWLLLAPSWLRAERQSAPGTPGGRSWTLAWQKAELRDFPAVFKGYSIYRRKLGDGPPGWSVREFGAVPPNWSLVREECMDEHYTDTVPDDEEYVYAIRVKDVLDYYSAPKIQDNIDPWVGTWEDNVRLVEGSFVVALRRGLTKINEDSDRRELERIAALNDLGEQQNRARQLRDHQKEREKIQTVILDLVEVGEHATRIGVPLELKIRRGGNKYFLAVTKVFWQDTGWTTADDIELVRDDASTLHFKTMPPEFPPLELRLRRAAEGGTYQILGDWTMDVPNDPNRTRFKFAWNFTKRP